MKKTNGAYEVVGNDSFVSMVGHLDNLGYGFRKNGNAPRIVRDGVPVGTLHFYANPIKIITDDTRLEQLLSMV